MIQRNDTWTRTCQLRPWLPPRFFREGVFMFRRISSYILFSAILCMSVLTSLCSYAQKQETIQAQAFGTSTMAGRTFGITIRINGYSTPADQKALIDAFNGGGHDAMVKGIHKMKSKGH